MGYISVFKKFFFLFVIYSLLFGVLNAQDSSQTTNHSDIFFAQDKGRHFIGSLMLTVLSAKITEHHFKQSRRNSKQVGAVVSFSIGLGKEVHDQSRANNRFSWKDMAVNVSGIIVGLLILGIE